MVSGRGRPAGAGELEREHRRDRGDRGNCRGAGIAVSVISVGRSSSTRFGSAQTGMAGVQHVPWLNCTSGRPTVPDVGAQQTGVNPCVRQRKEKQHTSPAPEGGQLWHGPVRDRARSGPRVGGVPAGGAGRAGASRRAAGQGRATCGHVGGHAPSGLRHPCRGRQLRCGAQHLLRESLPPPAVAMTCNAVGTRASASVATTSLIITVVRSGRRRGTRSSRRG